MATNNSTRKQPRHTFAGVTFAGRVSTLGPQVTKVALRRIVKGGKVEADRKSSHLNGMIEVVKLGPCDPAEVVRDANRSGGYSAWIDEAGVLHVHTYCESYHLTAKA